MEAIIFFYAATLLYVFLNLIYIYFQIIIIVLIILSLYIILIYLNFIQKIFYNLNVNNAKKILKFFVLFVKLDTTTIT